MILFNNRVKKSTIPNAGDGLFTTIFIEKGTPLWKKDMNDIIILMEEFETYRSLGLHEHIEKYATTDNEGNWYYDNDNFRFCNHSDEPNVIFQEYTALALRDIQPNEEIFVDYYSITTEQHANKLLGIK